MNLLGWLLSNLAAKALSVLEVYHLKTALIQARVGGLGQMPGWWYTIESTTTQHLLTQFEHACREALSSDRATREMMRAKSAKQRFPVIEWIRKLDKLQTTAIKMSERARKPPSTPRKDTMTASLPILRTNGNIGLGTPPISRPPTPPIPVPVVDTHSALRGSHSSSWRPSYANSLVSEPQAALLEPAKDRNRGARGLRHASDIAVRSLPRNISNTSLVNTSDDNCSIDHTESRRDTIEPPPKGSKLSRKLSLGTRLGPGHIRRKHGSAETIESLVTVDEGQRIHMSDDDDEQYIYTVEAIRRQFVSAQDAGTGYDTDGNDSSDQDDNTSPAEHEKPRRLTDSIYLDEENYLASRIRRQSEDIPPLPMAGLTPTYANLLNPSISPAYAAINSSHLSLASVLSGRDEFALAKVDDFFTDSDGKYFKRFQDALSKIDPKTSKAQLCIEEFLVKSEKDWSNNVRSRKLGLTSYHDREPKTVVTQTPQEVPSEESIDSHRSSAHPDSSKEDAPAKPVPPTGIKLFMQRRIGDWPIYAFLIALVRPLSCPSD